MSLDAETTTLTRHGMVTIGHGRIIVTGFDGSNATCRVVAALAVLWAIGELQRELVKIIEEPGKSSVAIGD